MVQYDFITYSLKSKFKFKGGPANYMQELDRHSAGILRQHSKPDSSLSYVMWQPYPCLKAAMDPVTKRFQCTECDPALTNVRLLHGQCELYLCKTGYMYNKMQESCA